MPVPNPTGALPARPVFKTVRKDTGEVITPRQVVLARNGDPFTFAYATRPTTPDKSGKVFVTDARGISQELYAHIFGLTVTRVIPCSTLGCKQPATHTLTYSFPESRSESQTDLVCEPCGDGYVSRPSLRAALTSGIAGGAA